MVYSNERLNPHFKVAISDAEGDVVILRNRKTNQMLKISAVEYAMLEHFAMDNDFEKTFVEYSSTYDLDRGVLYELIGRAKGLKLLIRDDELEVYESAADEDHIQGGLRILATSFLIILKNVLYAFLRLRLVIELRGSVRFYKVFAIDLKNTWLEKLCTSRLVQRLFLFLLAATLCVTGVDLIYRNEPLSATLTFDVLTLPTAVALVLLSVFVAASYCIHEMGHFVAYKYFQGTSNEMGFAFLYLFLPVVYTSTDSMHFWKNKWRRILVEGAGIVTDVAMVLSLAFVNNQFPGNPLRSTISILIIFVLVRIAANLNVFIPGTDMYFMLIDFLGVENFYERQYSKVKSDLSHLLGSKYLLFFESFGKHWKSHFYIYLGWLFISLHWISIFIILFLPFYLAVL